MKPWEVSANEAAVIGQRMRPRFYEADRVAAPLFLAQMADSDTGEGDKPVSQPPPPRYPGDKR